jgi:hypothetical protein
MTTTTAVMDGMEIIEVSFSKPYRRISDEEFLIKMGEHEEIARMFKDVMDAEWSIRDGNDRG